MDDNWIKMRCNLWTDPRVARLCDLTGQMEPTVIGGLFWFWSTVAQHSEDGFLPGMSLVALDRRVGVPGLGAALVAVGWLVDHPEGVHLVRFDDHNGHTAKQNHTIYRLAANNDNAWATQEASGVQQERFTNTFHIDGDDPYSGEPPAEPAKWSPARSSSSHAIPNCPHQEIIALYHELLPQCTQVRTWTPARAQALRARWNEAPERQSLDYWRQFFEYVASCDFLIGRGGGKTPFFADLEWITRAGNFAKIREGKYENRE